MAGSPELAERFLQAIIHRYNEDGSPVGYDTMVLNGLRDIKASDGKLTCRLKASPQVLNRYGTLHGGAIATIVDSVSSAALVTRSAVSRVSLSISVDYHSPLPGNEECLITAQVIKIGKTIASMTLDIYSQKTGRLVASGRHTKFLGDSQGVDHMFTSKESSRL